MTEHATLTRRMSGHPPRKHTPEEEEEIVMSTLRRLLHAIDCGDYSVYCELCDADLTSFEPEAHGQLIEGLTFHKFYFDNLRTNPGTAQSTVASPKFSLLGTDHALVTYTRVKQSIAADGTPRESASNETRVFSRSGATGNWICIHFHRSPC